MIDRTKAGRRTIKVSAQLMEYWMRGGYVTVPEGFEVVADTPKDLEIVGASFDAVLNEVHLIVRSLEWDDRPEENFCPSFVQRAKERERILQIPAEIPEPATEVTQ